MSKYQGEIKPTLVLMLAGMSRRYLDSGADKQKQQDNLTKMQATPIWAYSVYDAVKHANYGKLAMIIRRDFEEPFMEEFGKPIEKWAAKQGVEVVYGYQQSLEQIKQDRDYAYRTKMWGTGDAMLAAKDVVDEPFIILNGDDFYGRETFQLMQGFFNSPDYQPGKKTYALPGFILGNVLSNEGPVTRGICEKNADDLLTHIVEVMKMVRQGDHVHDNTTGNNYRPSELTSMNMWAYDPDIFPIAQERFEEHKRISRVGYSATRTAGVRETLAKTEFLLPSFMGDIVPKGLVTAKVIETPAEWFGITHIKDKDTAASLVAKLHDTGLYPKNLWE